MFNEIVCASLNYRDIDNGHAFTLYDPTVGYVDVDVGPETMATVVLW